MIKIDIEKPKYCKDCPCFFPGSNLDESACNITGEELDFQTYNYSISKNCPIKEITPLTDSELQTASDQKFLKEVLDRFKAGDEGPLKRLMTW